MAWIRGSTINGGGGGQPLKMVASSGAQSIQLPYYSDDGIKLKFKMLGGISDNAPVFGDVWSTAGVVFYFYNRLKLGLRVVDYLNENIPYTSFKLMNVEFDYSTGILTIDGNTYGELKTPGHNPIYLFGVSNRYSAVALSDISVEQNDVEIMHLEPRKNIQTGEGYYHDSIGNQDYYSITSTGLIYTELGG